MNASVLCAEMEIAVLYRRTVENSKSSPIAREFLAFPITVPVHRSSFSAVPSALLQREVWKTLRFEHGQHEFGFVMSRTMEELDERSELFFFFGRGALTAFLCT